MTPKKPNVFSCRKCNNPFTDKTANELISLSDLPPESNRIERVDRNKMIFVLKGSGSLKPAKGRSLSLREGTGLVLAMGTEHSWVVESEMTVAEFILDEVIGFTDISMFLPVTGKRAPSHPAPYPLESNEKIWLYMTGTVEFLKDGLSCRCYQRMKVEELFHILKVYYPVEILSRFFKPLGSRIPRFAMTVYEHWDKVEGLDDLAALTGLSLSGFSKKFRRVFGVSAYQWIMDKKGERIVVELYDGDKSIKQLSREYGFYSVQHFGYYCKKRFGHSPGKIRQMSGR